VLHDGAPPGALSAPPSHAVPREQDTAAAVDQVHEVEGQRDVQGLREQRRRVPEQERRQGQAQLVDQPGREQRRQQPGTALAQQPAQAPRAQLRHGVGQVDVVLPGDDDVGHRRQRPAASAVGGRAGHHDRGTPEAAGGGVEAQRAADQHERRALGEAALEPPGSPVRAGAHRPVPLGPRRPCADQDGVRHRAQGVEDDLVGGGLQRPAAAAGGDPPVGGDDEPRAQTGSVAAVQVVQVRERARLRQQQPHGQPLVASGRRAAVSDPCRARRRPAGRRR